MKIPLPNTNLSLEYLMQMQKSIDRYCLFCTKKENHLASKKQILRYIVITWMYRSFWTDLKYENMQTGQIWR